MTKTKSKKKPAVKKPAAKKAAPFLARGEKPFTLVNGKSSVPVLIVCDHASNVMPKSVKGLGLTAAQRRMHIAWDPGTAHIGRYLSKKLNTRLLLANFSRLVVDLNRGHDHPDCMRDVSDHVKVAGNRKLSADAKNARLDALYWPYHAEIDRHLDAFEAAGKVPLLLSLHSFTPSMDGFDRPWHIGVMWNRQEKLAKRLVSQLKRDNPALTIGENQPYSLQTGAAGHDTIHRHGEGRGLPYIIVEFRQDLVGGSKMEAEGWGELFLRSLRSILADATVYRRQPVAAKARAKKKPAVKKTAAKRKPAAKKSASKKPARRG